MDNNDNIFIKYWNKNLFFPRIELRRGPGDLAGRK